MRAWLEDRVPGDAAITLDRSLHRQNDDPLAGAPSMTFNGLSLDERATARMSLLRQGQVLYEGLPAEVNITGGLLHRMLVERYERQVGKRTLVCTAPVHVKAHRVPGACGLGRFTRTSLTCSRLESEVVELEADRLASCAPRSDRGFGVEIEMIMREIAVPMDAGTLFNETPYEVLERCFEDVTAAPPGDDRRSCKRNADCDLSEFCGFIPSRTAGNCQRRSDCKADMVATEEEGCPVPGEGWTWAAPDGSVENLTQALARALEAADEATEFLAETGRHVEVRSPKPPHALSGQSGLHSFIEVLAAMRHMGAQALPTAGFNVHVNVANPEAPGKLLTPADVAAVWMAYARYQLVIAEMLAPHRVGHHFARELFLGNCELARSSVHQIPANSNCALVRRMFFNIHTALQRPFAKESFSLTGFCNEAMAVEDGSPPVCEGPLFNGERFWQLNLVSLVKHGTLEFRAHSSTYDAERVARWVQFVVAFVEHFGAGRGRSEMERFWGSDEEADYAALQKAQQNATAAELFEALGEQLDPETASYYEERRWEASDPMCVVPPGPVLRHNSACTPGADGLLQAFFDDRLDTFVLPKPEVWHALEQQQPRALLPPDWKPLEVFISAEFDCLIPSVQENTGELVDWSLGACDQAVSFPRMLVETLWSTYQCCCVGAAGNCAWHSAEEPCPRVCKPATGPSTPECFEPASEPVNADQMWRCMQSHEAMGKCSAEDSLDAKRRFRAFPGTRCM